MKVEKKGPVVVRYKCSFQAGHFSDAMILGKKSVHLVGCFQLSWNKIWVTTILFILPPLNKDEHSQNYWSNDQPGASSSPLDKDEH